MEGRWYEVEPEALYCIRKQDTLSLQFSTVSTRKKILHECKSVVYDVKHHLELIYMHFTQ